MPDLHLATFSCDVTPPVGHPLCGGWITEVRGVDDPQKALGVVLLGQGDPIVLVAVDWCGLRNDAHLAFREAIAKAVHTSANRVAVHCVHQHNAPFADVEAEKLIQKSPMPATSLDLRFFERVVARVAAEAGRSVMTGTPWTHVGIGSATVREVASNRRIVDAAGKAIHSRTSASRDPKIRAFPEGLIDPQLKTLSFWNGSTPLAALNFYATHPMSYYGDGRVSADFCGLARQKRQDEERSVFQMYFTGAAGNVTAGKYNDGAPANRPVLRDKIYDAMTAAWKATRRQEVKTVGWRSEPITLPPRTEASFGQDESAKTLADATATRARRNNAAFQLAWLARQKRPIDVTCLDLGAAQMVHLPGEPFIQYQLFAQEQRKDSFVCTAGYGDGGPGYIPHAAAFLEGGYEPTVSLAGPRSEAILKEAIAKVLNPRR